MKGCMETYCVLYYAHGISWMHIYIYSTHAEVLHEQVLLWVALVSHELRTMVRFREW